MNFAWLDRWMGESRASKPGSGPPERNRVRLKGRYQIPKVGREPGYVWYVNPKVARTSILQLLTAHTDCSPCKALDQQDFLMFFKFGFVRNPWDRLVSCYFSKVVEMENRKFPDFSGSEFRDFVGYVERCDLRGGDRHYRLQSVLVPVDTVDFVGRFESFERDARLVCTRLGLPVVELPHRNRSGHRHYVEYYDATLRRRVAALYAQDIETFGYSFEG